MDRPIFSREEMLELPLSSIVDGWLVREAGKEYVYLFVRTPHGNQQTILIERPR